MKVPEPILDGGWSTRCWSRRGTRKPTPTSPTRSTRTASPRRSRGQGVGLRHLGTLHRRAVPSRQPRQRHRRGLAGVRGRRGQPGARLLGHALLRRPRLLGLRHPGGGAGGARPLPERPERPGRPEGRGLHEGAGRDLRGAARYAAAVVGVGRRFGVGKSGLLRVSQRRRKRRWGCAVRGRGHRLRRGGRPDTDPPGRPRRPRRRRGRADVRIGKTVGRVTLRRMTHPGPR